jgi:hypothetical protein
MLGLQFVKADFSANFFFAFGQKLQATIYADLNGQRSLHVCSLCGSSILLNFSSWLMSSGFKSLHFWLCPSGLNKPQTGHWKTGVYDSRNALDSASALRTLAQYARPILLVSSLKASNLSKPSCILPVNKEKPNAPPELLPNWCGVVSDNLCL